MSLLKFRTPKCVITRSCMSWTGKYKFYLGHHYNQGVTCYDVGSINQQTGEIITRHYHDKSYPNPKIEALAFYEDWSKKLKEKPRDEEKNSNNPHLADAFRRALGGKSN